MSFLGGFYVSGFVARDDTIIKTSSAMYGYSSMLANWHKFINTSVFYNLCITGELNMLRSIDGFALIYAKLKSMSWRLFLQKAWRRLGTLSKLQCEAFVDVRRETRNLAASKLINSYMDVESVDIQELNDNEWDYRTGLYLEHTFDFLGSGPVNVAHNNNFVEREGNNYPASKVSFTNYRDLVCSLLREAHAELSIRIGSLIDREYIPIDWQVDFKSGFRWSEKTPSSKIIYGDILGVDIKIPWELARLQHLPQLAIQSLRDSSNSFIYCLEIQNQILDFITMNPPRMGVNWVCTMDVGIRVANMLIANDIAKNAVGYPVDNGYRKIFAQSVFEHGAHILDHLEYSPELTSNHYLANIVGLLFVSAYLEANQTTNQWLAFSIQELISEVERQYYEDGTNFEGSSSYHRLSTEMILYGIAVIRGLPDERVESLKSCPVHTWKKIPGLRPYTEQEYQISNSKVELPEWFCRRVLSAIQFSIAISKPDGNVCQFGDNDSGRFFKFTSIGVFRDKEEALKRYLNLTDGEASNYKDNKYWDENCLNHSAYISAASAIFQLELPEHIYRCELEKSIVSSLSNGNFLDYKHETINETIIEWEVTLSDLKYRKSIEISVGFDLPIGKDLLEGLQQYWYPNSLILIFKSNRFYLCFYSIPNGSRGNGVHSHNDQLSIELMVDGKDVCKDPGSFLYTPNPEMRNKFRSVHAHNTLRAGGETNGFFGAANALFAKQNNTRGNIAGLTQFAASMTLKFGQTVQRRTVTILEKTIVIEDQSNEYFENSLNPHCYFSNGYGKILKCSLEPPNCNIEYKAMEMRGS